MINGIMSFLAHGGIWTLHGFLSRVYAVYPQMTQIYADMKGRSIRMGAEFQGTI